MAGFVPLVDTLFLLLFALLTAAAPGPPANKDRVRVRLPEAEASTTRVILGRGLVLTVSREGDIFVESQARPASSLAELDRRLRGFLSGRLPEEFTVHIYGDQGAPLGVVVALLQHLRIAGFRKVDLAAELAEGAPPLGPGLPSSPRPSREGEE